MIVLQDDQSIQPCRPWYFPDRKEENLTLEILQ
jgi:hypothetical protein